MAILKNYYRPQDNRMVAGVCAGIARPLNVSPNLVRLAMGAGLFAGGATLWVYPIAWAVMPDEGANESFAEELADRAKGYANEDQLKQMKDKLQDTQSKMQSKLDDVHSKAQTKLDDVHSKAQNKLDELHTTAQSKMDDAHSKAHDTLNDAHDKAQGTLNDTHSTVQDTVHEAQYKTEGTMDNAESKPSTEFTSSYDTNPVTTEESFTNVTALKNENEEPLS